MNFLSLLFFILLSIGAIVLFLISFLCFYKYLVMEKRCTQKVSGVIKKYTMASHNGLHLPVVYYNVNGEEFKVVGPEYKFVVSSTKTTPISNNSVNVKEENQNIFIDETNNSLISIRKNPISELYPIDSEIDVYYDPNNPKLSFVLRYCNKKWAFWLCFLAGVFVLALDIIILFVG